MSLRAIKTKARTALHHQMRVRAFYYPAGNPAAEPATVHVRVHTKFDAQLGDLKGTNFNYAEIEAQVPRLVFWRSEQEPDNLAVVMISADEGYRINHVHEPDGLTRKAEVETLDAADRAQFDFPEPEPGVP